MSTLFETDIANIISILLEPSITFIIGVITILISKNDNVSSIALERLKNVYHPLFIAIEPFLYKMVSYNDITPFLEKYNEIEKNYSLLIRPSLRQHIQYLSPSDGTYKTDKYGHNKWFLICDYISKDYDRLCKQTHLPIRSVAYRVNYRQYRSKISVLLATVWLNAPAIVIFSLLLGAMYPPLLVVTYFIFFFILINKIINYL